MLYDIGPLLFLSSSNRSDGIHDERTRLFYSDLIPEFSALILYECSCKILYSLFQYKLNIIFQL